MNSNENIDCKSYEGKNYLKFLKTDLLREQEQFDKRISEFKKLVFAFTEV